MIGMSQLSIFRTHALQHRQQRSKKDVLPHLVSPPFFFFLLHLLNYQAVRSQFGVVMQDATVFSGTVRENSAFNDPTSDLDNVVRSAGTAELPDDMMSMLMGYDTSIAEQGSMLSGGQRQHLMLARAVWKRVSYEGKFQIIHP